MKRIVSFTLVGGYALFVASMWPDPLPHLNGDFVRGELLGLLCPVAMFWLLTNERRAQ